MKKILLLILIMPVVVQAVDTELQDLAELVAIISTDILYVVDDPAGAPASRKITALNLFDMIDTFAELNTITADETLVSEEGTPTLDALWTFDLGITITTGDPLTFGVNRIDNGADLLDGEMIGADTIDDDSIDFGDVTGLDLTLTDCGAITSTGTITATVGFDIVGAADIDYGSVDVLDHTFATDGTGDGEIVLPNDSIGDAEIDWVGLTTSADFTVTGTLIASVGIDTVGAADMDYGSIDVTDHSFTTDDCTFIIDGGITVSTGDVITLGAVQWNSADEIDGTKIKDADYGDVDVSAGGAWTLDTDSVADNEIDYANVTFADFDYETAWKMWHSNAAGDVTEITLGADTTFLESNGAGAAPAFRAIADGDIPDNITVDLATLATTVTLVDDDVTNDNQDIVFTTDAAGPVNLEADIGDFHYNPFTGTVTATEFAGGGAGITGTLTAYDDIADPDAASSISFADGETVTWATAEDSAGSFFLIQNSDAALAANTYLLDLDYSVDDNEANADYFRCQDAGGVVFTIQQDGDTASTGNIEGATITEGGNAVPNATDHLGFFGGTTSAQLLAEISNETGSGLACFATAPVFTTSIQLTGADADPAAAAGTIVYDNTIGVMSGGGLRWYDNDSVRLIVDLETDPSNDDYIVAYDAGADGFYMMAGVPGVTKLNDIGDADGAGTVVSGAHEHLWTWENDAANEVFMNFSSIDADTDNNQWIFELSTYDDGDANVFFMRCRDDVDTTPNTVFEIAADGATSMDAGLTVGGSITEGGVAVPNVDEIDWVAAAEMADADHGDVAWSGGDASVQACTLADSVYASCYVGIFEAATGADQPFYTDGALTYDAATGTLGATHFSGGGANLTTVDAATGDSATAFFDAGTIEHEWGGLQANVAAYTGLIGITGADTTVEVDLLSELLTAMGDVTAFITDDDMPAVGVDPDVDAAGEIGRDTDGANETGDSYLRGHDGSNQFFYAGKVKTISIPVNNPDGLTAWAGRANPSQPVWLNTSGMTFTIIEVMAISDVDNYDCTLFESNTLTDVSDENDVSIIALECDADGTEGYTDTEVVAHAVEHDHWIIFEDTLGDAGGVTVIIKGWFNADVD